MDEKAKAGHLERLARDGYTVVENAIEPALVDALNAALERLERELDAKPAMNGFEGHRTVRIYNLLAHGAPFERVPAHENVLPLIEGVLDAGCLISSLSSIAIDPGESAQPIHADDMVIPLEKPHRAIVCNSMWALTDFTDANGATRLVPGTHRKANPDYGGAYETIPAEMAWRWREPHRQAPHRHRDELLRRLHPPAGEPAARVVASAGEILSQAVAGIDRLWRLSRPDRTHRQEEPGADSQRRRQFPVHLGYGPALTLRQSAAI